jgi:hypothetical protein
MKKSATPPCRTQSERLACVRGLFTAVGDSLAGLPDEAQVGPGRAEN